MKVRIKSDLQHGDCWDYTSVTSNMMDYLGKIININPKAMPVYGTTARPGNEYWWTPEMYDVVENIKDKPMADPGDSAKKYDDGKCMLDLIPPVFTWLVGRVFTFGAKKYGADNWKLNLDKKRIVAALKRHIEKYLNDEQLDTESGLPHLAHAACNIAFLLWYEHKDMKLQ